MRKLVVHIEFEDLQELRRIDNFCAAYAYLFTNDPAEVGSICHGDVRFIFLADVKKKIKTSYEIIDKGCPGKE